MSDATGRRTGQNPTLPLIVADATLREAAAAIDRGAIGIALVVRDDDSLIATITDGDIRRAMLDGVELDAEIGVLLERKRGTAYETPATAPETATDAELLAAMVKRRIRQLPVVDGQGCPVRVATIDDLAPRSTTSPSPTTRAVTDRGGPMTAVVMAGGFGSRLGDLTAQTPKPMLHVGDRPLLEHTVERLREIGVASIAISTHYLAERIREHFGAGERHGVRITYLDERAPLGTAGCLSMLGEPPPGPLLVLNGDILTSVDFNAMRHFHDEHAASMTVAVRKHSIAVPYGVAECEGAVIRSLVEKPTYSVLVNAGMYVIERHLLERIPEGRRYDMTQLIDDARESGEPVCAFPIREYWLDIGLPEDYERAQREAPEVITQATAPINERLAS